MEPAAAGELVRPLDDMAARGCTGVNVSANGPGLRDLCGDTPDHFARVRDAVCSTLRVRGAMPVYRFEALVAEYDSLKVEVGEAGVASALARDSRAWIRGADDLLQRIGASAKADPTCGVGRTIVSDP